MKFGFGARIVGVAGLVAGVGASYAFTNIGTAFTYQGRLVKDGTPVTSDPPHCDFTFGLFAVPTGGSHVGTSPQVFAGIAVSDGLFTVNLDFGPAGIDGTARWLDITVQCPGDGGPTPLTPRQELKPTPHALALPGLYTQENATSPNVIGGYNGILPNTVRAGVVGATIAGGGSPDLSMFWGEYNRVNDDFGAVGGGYANRAGGQPSTGEGRQATVSGGAYNTAAALASTVSGGNGNQARGPYSAIGGGLFNNAVGDYATIPGGRDNEVSGNYSFVAGRRAKVPSGGDGAFVWADSTDADFTSTGPNQFLIRATGGMRLATGDATTPQFQAILPSTDTPEDLAINPLGGNVGVGTASPPSRLSVYEDGDSATQTDFTQDNANAGINIMTDFVAGNYTPGVFWSTVNNNAGNPKAGIYLRETGLGTEMRFGTSNNFATGITNDALTIDPVGNVGLGTAAPAMTLDVNGGAFFEGNSIYVRNPAAAATTQTWGILVSTSDGKLNFGEAADVASPGSLSSTRMVIERNGNVGIGDVSPSVALDVVGDINYTGVITDVSDERLKENVLPVRNAIGKIDRLRGVYFNMKDNPGQREVGLIAQNVQEVLPEAVRIVDTENGYLGVSYPSLIALLVEAIKDVQAEITANHNNGAALAAFQEMNQMMQEKDCEIEELREQMANLEAIVRTIALKNEEHARE